MMAGMPQDQKRESPQPAKPRENDKDKPSEQQQRPDFERPVRGGPAVPVRRQG